MIAGHGSRRPQREDAALAALLSEPTIAEAAAKAGIGEATLLRWLADPEFKARYREARRRVVEHAVSGLQRAAGKAVAALAVIAHHIVPAWFSGFAVANLGVMLFFSLSGFLIYLLALREYERTGRLSIRHFYQRRILRIWPLYFAFILLGVASFSVVGISTGNYLARYGYVYPAFLTNIVWSFNYIGGWFWPPVPYLLITWSITIEEQFYLVFPALFLLAMRRPHWRPALILGMLGGALVLRWLFTLLPVEPPTADQIAARPELAFFSRPNDGRIGNLGGLYYATFSYVDVFLLGGLAAHLYHRRGRFGERPWLMAALLVGSLALLWWLTALWTPILWPPYSTLGVLIYTFLAVPLAGLVYASVVWTGAPWSKLLRAYPLRVLGFLSYAMYLVHFPAQALTDRWHNGVPAALDLSANAGAAVYLLYVTALTVAIAALAHALIERPFLMLKDRSRRRSGLTSTTVPWLWCLGIALATVVTLDTAYWRVWRMFG